LQAPAGFAILQRIFKEERSIARAVLVLEDGSVFEGRGFGAAAEARGEVVFNTGMVGYPESVTDPSYRGQILCQTYPLIGNYGIDPAAFESDKPHISGYVVCELCERPSHKTSTRTLDDWLRENGIPGIADVDTRALTKKLRTRGVMLGILAHVRERRPLDAFIREAARLPDPNERNLVAEVTVPGIEIHNPSGRTTVALLHCGAKANIIRCLVKRDIRLVCVPADTSFRTVMEYSPQGVCISNGPGDPKLCQTTIYTVKRIMAERIPVFGICLGNQILALAAGANTYKLKFGHRSQNQPCLEEGTGRCYITSQNHGYAVDTKTLPRDWLPWFTNANDGTNEGIIHRRKPFSSVQFHPEACPGPTDTEFLFDRFQEMIR
jgi:carbamoyl-phosphate synthase small subunit